jgi:hypothetical protein
MNTITLDNWRFEYLKDERSSWNLLKVGGVIRPDDDTDPKHAQPFGSTVTDLQAFNEVPQFEEGFVLQTEGGTVVLGKKEVWDAPSKES